MSRRPNFLLVVADDHQADALGCAGHPDVRTPHLDALAAGGVRFSRAYHGGSTVGAVCVPTRACLLTGVELADAVRDPWQDLRLRPERPLLPEVLRSAGYRTHAVGKWHNDGLSLNRGFEDGGPMMLQGMADHWATPVQPYDPTGRYEDGRARPAPGFSTEVFAAAAEEFLRGADGARPFFLYLALTSPHDPRTPPPPFDRAYDLTALRLPPNFAPVHAFDNGSLAVRDERLAAWPRDAAEVRRHLAAYYGMISHHDAVIGRVFAALRARGDGRPTFVVYTSDHGLAVGQHGLLGKQNLYEHSVRVPLVVSGPGLRRGVARSLVRSLDLFPTVCALAGVEPPPGLAGRPLPLTGPDRAPRRRVNAFHGAHQRMVCTPRWKLIETALPGASPRRQLFDLTRDPWETGNLAEMRPVLATRLARRCKPLPPGGPAVGRD